MTLGWISNLFHSKAKAKPMGRVKYTSNHSSVSSDFMETFNSSLKLFPTLYYLFSFLDSLLFIIYHFSFSNCDNCAHNCARRLFTTPRETGPVVEVDDTERSVLPDNAVTAIDLNTHDSRQPLSRLT